MIKIRKQSFLLLEVLIAFTLVVLCIIPLLAPHVGIYKEQKHFINQIEWNHAVHLIYVDVLEKMHKGEISIADIITKREFEVPRDRLPSPSITAIYRLSPLTSKKQNAEGFNVHLANLEIILTEKNKPKPWVYAYSIFYASQTSNPEAVDDTHNP